MKSCREMFWGPKLFLSCTLTSSKRVWRWHRIMISSEIFWNYLVNIQLKKSFGPIVNTVMLDYKNYSFVHPNLDSWAVKSPNWWWWWCNKGDHFSQFTNIGDNIQDKDNKKDGSSIFGLCRMAGKSKGPEKVRENI